MAKSRANAGATTMKTSKSSTGAEIVPVSFDRRRLAGLRRWVVKIGSSLLTDTGKGIDRARIAAWAEGIAKLRGGGHDVVLVSSGAIAEGISRLDLAARPQSVNELQAAAAVGQMGLIEAWERALQTHGLHTALVLLTHEDLSDRRRYLNARATLRTLLQYQVVPVVNENDTVATDEIRFGDNDTLAALVSNLVEADGLVLLTDRAGLHEADPAVDSKAPLVRCARAEDSALDLMAGASPGGLGRGGMLTKLRGARLAARAGALTLIADGREMEVMQRLVRGEELGTLLVADRPRIDARKQWIAGQLQTHGALILDAGAVNVLINHGRSLLPVGVVGTRGEFMRGDVVVCEDEGGRAIARGLVNYSAEETLRIMGEPSDRIREILGYQGEPELVHRDNLVLV
jgi:glutamate 5-kinase